MTDGNCVSAMEKPIAPHCSLGIENGTFYLISRDHNQPIKLPEFNEVLHKIYSIIGTVYIVK